MSRRVVVFATLLAIVVVAAVLRLHRLDELPPGLFIDQAQYGLDAYRIAQGETFPVFVEGPGGNQERGREPLFMVLMAGVFLLLGPTPLSIKLTSALIGIATVAATYLAASRWLGARVGLLAAAMLAVSSWHVTFSRMGFRAILTPLWVSLVVLALGELAQRRTVISAVAFGVVLGAGFYTYPAYWSVPLALALVLVVALLERRQDGRRRQHGHGPPSLLELDVPGARKRLVAAAVAFLLTMTPLVAYASTRADDLLARAREVALVGSESEPARDESVSLRDSAQRVLFMLHLRGDTELRHNVPGRPMLDVVSGTLFLAGLAALARARWRASFKTAILALWLLPLVPSAATLAAPNALRAVGALPAVCLIAALGLDAVLRLLERLGDRAGDSATAGFPGRAGRAVAVAAALLAIGSAAALNARAYFVEWASLPGLADEFSGDIPRFVDYLGELANGAEVVACPYVYSSPNIAFLTLRRDPPLRPLDSVDALVASASDSARDRVFVCDEPAVNALLQRLYPEAEEIGRYAIYTARTGRILRVPAKRMWASLPPAEETQARYFIARMNDSFAERSRAW